MILFFLRLFDKTQGLIDVTIENIDIVSEVEMKKVCGIVIEGSFLDTVVTSQTVFKKWITLARSCPALVLARCKIYFEVLRQ